MMKVPKLIAELILKLEAGTASPEEVQKIQEWYHSFDDSTAFINEKGEPELLRTRMHKRLIAEIGNSRKVVPLRRWMSAAAVLIFLLAGISYFLFYDRQPDTHKLAELPPLQIKDVKPGGNRALLTLADGSSIILDSAANGILSTQGNIQVEKLNNGLLAYQMNGKLVTEEDARFYNTISTPRGGQYQVTLSDGTKVWLNAASSIRFPVVFNGNERKVEITGEAYFEVAKNPAQPFSVKAMNSKIEVLGTHFNVNAYNDEEAIRTTLLEGKVKVSIPGNPEPVSFLSPGQQSVQKNGHTRVLDHADTEEAVAWINGRFQFKSADLRSILRQIARWYDVEVIYQGNVDLHFTGQLTRNQNVSKVFEKLQLTGEVHFRIDGNKVIVSR